MVVRSEDQLPAGDWGFTVTVCPGRAGSLRKAPRSRAARAGLSVRLAVDVRVDLPRYTLLTDAAGLPLSYMRTLSRCRSLSRSFLQTCLNFSDEGVRLGVAIHELRIRRYYHCALEDTQCLPSPLSRMSRSLHSRSQPIPPLDPKLRKRRASRRTGRM